MNNSSGLGLRERKRARTSEVIHIAAAELALERGLDAATIEMISDRAGVSTRTFFNYFPTKEDAVLGIDEVAVSAELDRVRGCDEDVFLALFDLITALFEATGGGIKSDLKRDVIRKYPQLMTRQMVRVAELEDRLSAIIAGWLAKDARFAEQSEAEHLEAARIILGVSLATVRITMKKWASDPDPTTGPPASAAPRETYERAIATLRTVLEKLT
ncbi:MULTISPECIES: TetR/AcrR family transcriptional regulator [unclassified Cryobacterium]|uniref:TetR/AcrR family transcriptional regulator n=1 Tax=unclassified Cryobacterium TaxID=2649013 RepID=UPI002AB4D595|nr:MULTISPECIES: TetR/AcrR family transcriptional regulator [unclassified Cryobacterium]MDY7528851.1 TetR/AcrR family transcriptional regulator [Cryobacterium sp. 10C2]MDY7555409.1 TetR/AcrR family transcriptional regulator [Cryobacterium sp. 10C3]MEB0201046.1 TetR/AcrR family transcriptional regulator [Cryobacterium sp. 5I3]MEB0288466.1 TetR/AcrR family transcriptional regulator [Cryobacterium sp. 10S3]MEB0291445.1 TetR/AcrR family transcriptional regulator [Cryobacterium sp. 10C2]